MILRSVSFTYASHLFWCYDTQWRILVTMVRLTIPPVYFMQAVGCCCKLLHPERSQRAVKSLLTNLSPLSVNMYEAIPCGMTLLLKNIFDDFVEFIQAVWIAHDNFKDHLFITSTCWFLVLLVGSVAEMSIASNSRVPAAGKRWSLGLCITQDPLYAHEPHLSTSMYSSFTMCW